MSAPKPSVLDTAKHTIEEQNQAKPVKDSALKNVLDTIGYSSQNKQVALVKLLHFTGSFDLVPNNNKYKESLLLDDYQAGDLLNDNSLFLSHADAHSWLKKATQEKFMARDEKGKPKDYIYTDDKRFPAEYRPAVTELLETLGLVNEVRPGAQEYDYGLVLGAREAAVKKRIDHMAELYKNDGVRFNKVALLGSNRPLLAEQERASAVHIIAAELPNSSDGGDKKNNLAKVNRAFDEVEDDSNFTAQMIQDTTKRNKAKAEAIMEKLDITYDKWPTEIQMIQHVYEHNKERVSDPSAAPLGVISIEAPMYRKNSRDKSVPKSVLKNTDESIGWLVAGKLRRANTADTVTLFKNHPDVSQGGRVLAISSQPYNVHQHAQLRSLLPEELFLIDTVSSGIKNKDALKLQDALGSIAKSIYAGYPRAHQKIVALDKDGLGQEIADEMTSLPATVIQEIKEKAAKTGKTIAETIVKLSSELKKVVAEASEDGADGEKKTKISTQSKLKESTIALRSSLENMTKSLTQVGGILERLRDNKTDAMNKEAKESEEKEQAAKALNRNVQSNLLPLGSGDAEQKISQKQSGEEEDKSVAENVVRRRERYAETSRSA